MNISDDNIGDVLKNYQNDDIKKSLKEISIDIEWVVRDMEDGKFIESTIYINGNAYTGKVWSRNILDIRSLGLSAISNAISQWEEQNIS